jgi:hypothetical protein
MTSYEIHTLTDIKFQWEIFLMTKSALKNIYFTCHMYIDAEMGQKLDSKILETGVKTRNSFARALNEIAIENSLAVGESKRALRSSSRFNPQTENKENNAPERTLKLNKQEKESIDVVSNVISTTRHSRASNKTQKVNYLSFQWKFIRTFQNEANTAK